MTIIAPILRGARTVAKNLRGAGLGAGARVGDDGRQACRQIYDLLVHSRDINTV
jgi:hypothetical protein